MLMNVVVQLRLLRFNSQQQRPVLLGPPFGMAPKMAMAVDGSRAENHLAFLIMVLLKWEVGKEQAERQTHRVDTAPFALGAWITGNYPWKHWRRTSMPRPPNRLVTVASRPTAPWRQHGRSTPFRWRSSIEFIKCIGASLKAGCYRSANLYFQAAINFQLRHLREPVHPLLRSTVRDVVRSIRRGLGPSKLKDGFDPLQLANVIEPNNDKPFDIEDPSHVSDVILLGCWFMLRELELAAASRHHLWIEVTKFTCWFPCIRPPLYWGSYHTSVEVCVPNSCQQGMPMALRRTSLSPSGRPW